MSNSAEEGKYIIDGVVLQDMPAAKDEIGGGSVEMALPSPESIDDSQSKKQNDSKEDDYFYSDLWN